MSDPERHLIAHKELAALLVRHFDIQEGYWMLQVNFGLAAGNAGPSPDELAPTAFVGVTSVGIARVPDAKISALVVDAADVNPGAARKPRRRKAKASASSA